MKYKVKWTSKFKREYKLAQKRGYDMNLMNEVIRLLAKGDEQQKLINEYDDHPLDALREDIKIFRLGYNLHYEHKFFLMEVFNMKKVFLCVLLVTLSVSAAFGNAQDDLLKAVNNPKTTPQDIRKIIKAGADVNYTYDGRGSTALMIAIRFHLKSETIKALIKAGADVNAEDGNYTTALTDAVVENNPEVVKILLESGAGAKVNIKDGYLGMTNLMSATDTTPEIVKMLLDAGADVNAKSNNNQTALMFAVVHGNLDIIKILISAGADINAHDEEFTTVLMYASKSEFTPNPDVIRLLIEAGANANARNGGGKTAEDLARENGNLEIAKLLNNTPISTTSKNATDNLIKALDDEDRDPRQIFAPIFAGADVNSQGKKSGWTPLNLAVTLKCDIQFIKFLINSGANVNNKNAYGLTVLMTAVFFNNNVDVIKLLLENGADVNIIEHQQGKTALILAAQRNTNPEVIRALLEAGANIKVASKEGKTAKDYAMKNENPSIQQLVNILDPNSLLNATQENLKLQDILSLIRIGADVNAKNKNGTTVLMIAAANTSYPDVIRELVKAGANVNAKSNDGQTALMYAARFNPKPQILRALISAGADVKATDSFFFGKTAKDYAEENGASPEIIKILEGL